MKPRLLANENFRAPSVRCLRELTALAILSGNGIEPAKAFGCGLLVVRRV